MKKNELQTKKKELKERLCKIQDELHELMSEFHDLDLNVEVHMIIEREHYQLDVFRLYSDEHFNGD